MPSVEWNKKAWGKQHGWSEDGDEWNGMARYCHQPYAEWKRSLVETFIEPNSTGKDVLEIAPGHGRWTGYIVAAARTVTMVDINQSCLDACRERFADQVHVSYHLGEGSSLPSPDASVDFVWSFDSVVHMDGPDVSGYVREIGRVLRPGGVAILHHADKRPWSLALRPATSRLGKPGRVAQRLAAQGRLHDGNRSDITAEMMRAWAREAHMAVELQTRSWGERDQYNVTRFHDLITVIRKPAAVADR